MSGKLARAGEPLWETCADAGGGASEAASNGLSSDSASRARRLAAAKRIPVAAWMSAGGGGRAVHKFKKVRRRACSSSSAKAGCIFTAAARRVGKSNAGEKASWGPGEGPGRGPPRRGGIQYCEGRRVQFRKVVVQGQDAMQVMPQARNQGHEGHPLVPRVIQATHRQPAMGDTRRLQTHRHRSVPLGRLYPNVLARTGL